MPNDIIIGYKCFQKGLTNQYGTQFEVGKTYSIPRPISFGNQGNGYHLCTNLEDTLRFFDFDEEKDICVVLGFGDKVARSDEYYGYYDMYSVEHIHVVKKLSREEIIQIGLNLNSIHVPRFVQGFKLTPEEISLFKEQFKSEPCIIKAIQYYQEHDLEAYKRQRIL